MSTSAAAAASTTTNSNDHVECLADSLPESERIQKVSVHGVDTELPQFDPATTVVVLTNDGTFRCPVNRTALRRFCQSFRLMSEARVGAGEADLAEWRLPDPITANRQNLSYFASWVNYYAGGSASGSGTDVKAQRRTPTCATFPIFMGPVDYVIEPADFLFIEKEILGGKGLAGASGNGSDGIMRLIALGEFAAAVDCGMLRDLCAAYVAAKVREADEQCIEGVGPTADTVVRGWFGLSGQMSAEEIEAAKKKFGAAMTGENWQDLDRRAQAAQKAAGVLPLQPY